MKNKLQRITVPTYPLLQSSQFQAPILDMLCPAHRKGQVRVKIRRRNQYQKKLWGERRFRTGPTEGRYRYKYQKHGTSDVGIAGTNIIAGTDITGTGTQSTGTGATWRRYRYPVVLKGSTTPYRYRPPRPTYYTWRAAPCSDGDIYAPRTSVQTPDRRASDPTITLLRRYVVEPERKFPFENSVTSSTPHRRPR